MNRRDFLKTTGGNIIVAAGGSGCAFIGSANPALAPWLHAGSSYTEPRQRALSYAILAPNPHNRQPWLADLSTKNTVVLYVDTERMLFARGLIDIQRHATDGRSKVVFLTSAGHEFHAVAINNLGDAIKKLGTLVNVDELIAILPVLQRLREALDANRDL